MTYPRIVGRRIINHANLVLPAKSLNKSQTRFIEDKVSRYSAEEQRVFVPLRSKL